MPIVLRTGEAPARAGRGRRRTGRLVRVKRRGAQFPRARRPIGGKAVRRPLLGMGTGLGGRNTRRAWRAGALLIAMGGAGHGVPAVASAGFETFGSNLQAEANHTEAHQADTAFWLDALPSAAPTSPVGGQVVEVRLKGIAPRATPPYSEPADKKYAGSPMLHFQVLAPAQGTWRARNASQDFYVPTEGDPQQITTYKPENQCISAGDTVAFNTIGGYDGVPEGTGPYPKGTPFQIFSRGTGATTSWFEAHGFWLGDSPTRESAFFPRPGEPADRRGTLDGVELLIQMRVATGPDAFYMCPGGTNNPYRPADPPKTVKPGAGATGGGTSGSGGGGGGGTAPAKDDPIRAAATIPAGKKASVDSKGFVSVGLHCPSLKPCKGVLTLAAGKTALGKGAYSIAKGKSRGVRFKLSRKGLKFVKRKRYKVKATVTAVTDGAGTHVGKVKLKKRGA